MTNLISRFLAPSAGDGDVASAAARLDDDGYDLWLRYLPLAEARKTAVGANATALVVGDETPVLKSARAELERALFAMLIAPVPVRFAKAGVTGAIEAGAILVGTPQSLPVLATLDLPLGGLGTEGYVVRSAKIDGVPVTVIAANEDVGVLYGCFAFLRHIQTGGAPDSIDLVSAPKLALRLLNHWDNLDGSIERGYAGFSIWDWWTLPDHTDPRYIDYARATASIGINGTVLNNVNAAPDMLSPFYLVRVAKLADIFRPYGIKVFLSVNFATPKDLDGLPSIDPLDAEVRDWWQRKADEIYALIPDFGGFLVKANSEGQPGPNDSGRNHADGANMIADALAPHGGILIWRTFVYSSDPVADRAAEALDEFKPLDGAFRPNVILQVKNGPVDFQPREPFSPIFGQMTKTSVMMEFQITKEYLGQATHLCYLGPCFEEVLQFDTYVAGKGTSVANILKGEAYPQTMTGMAGVANIGTDRAWTGGVFNQANWYAFGRLAWDPDASAREIAEEWVKMSFGTAEAVVGPIVDIMMGSHEVLVNYMMPLGLHHQFATGHHYGPGPWISDLTRPEWNPTYYNRADKNGVGFDRTRTGSNAVAQYAPELAALFADPQAFDEKYLLWFHHVPWDFTTKSGKTLWAALVEKFDSGVAGVGAMRETWQQMKPHVDARRFAQVNAFLAIQQREAQWWRDASLAYFGAVSGLPMPDGHAPPAHPLEHYKVLEFRFAPGRPE